MFTFEFYKLNILLQLAQKATVGRGHDTGTCIRLTSVACGGGIQSSDVAGGRAFRWLGVLLTWAEAEASRALTWAVGGDGLGYC